MTVASGPRRCLNLEHAAAQRRPAQSARADRLEHIPSRCEAGPRRRRVRRNHPVEIGFAHHVEEGVELVVVEIGRDLQQQGNPSFPRIVVACEGREERAGEVRTLKSPQPLRVRRRDVHDDEVRHRPHRAEAREVVVDDRADGVDRDCSRLADREPHGHTRPTSTDSTREPLGDGARSIVGEAETVHERVVVREPEKIGRRVGLLRLCRHRTELEKPEAERRERTRNPRVLVEAASQPDRRGKREAKALLLERERWRQARVHEVADRRESLERGEGGHPERVGFLGRNREEERSQKAVHRGGDSTR